MLWKIEAASNVTENSFVDNYFFRKKFLEHIFNKIKNGSVEKSDAWHIINLKMKDFGYI